jgi:hypothetical protein
MFGLKLDSGMDLFVLFIIVIKFVFIIAAIGHVILTHTDTKFEKYDSTLVYWKERTEFVFILTMAILLIYHFHPKYHTKPISSETKLLFFLFGWVLIITAKWGIFVKESPLFKEISNAVN